jgi:aryl-alcohol dehydrogenase-like predicted oxidoreductase
VISVDTWAEALDGEQGKGNVRRVGVSNWTVERFTALRKRLDDDQLTTFSNHFSLAQMIEPPWPGCLAIDPDTARNLGSAGTTVLAWASLARGYLCGSGRDPTVERCWGNRANQLRRARAAELATRLGTTAAAVAIAYVLAHEGVRPVIGTRSAAHLDEALAAEAIALTPEQVVQLESGISR